MPKTKKDREEALRAWQATPVYLTPEGLERLKGKLAHLKNILPGLIDETARTGAYGDRSDSVEYTDAKGRLRRTQNQIYRIEDELKKVEIITSGPSAKGTVQIGSIVCLESGAVKKTFQILGPKETNPGAGAISYLSPLGAALLERAAGEEVEVQTASGIKKYRITEIR
jgi:transcription elongation GreA/GreB family factor